MKVWSRLWSVNTMSAHLANDNDKPSLLRTLLVLGRVSNLPTVWSNCLAGWLIGGAGEWRVFFQLCLGASLLYVGGMFLNDARDEGFDRAHRPERPIPSGAISSRAVWMLSLVTLGLGALVLVFTGRALILPTLGLLACIVVYDVVHKQTVYAPLLMAGCRFLLYVVAGAAARGRVGSAVLWSAGALAVYIVGLSYLARKESAGTETQGWPLPLLLLPVLVAAIQSNRDMTDAVLWLLFLGWVLFALQPLRGLNVANSFGPARPLTPNPIVARASRPLEQEHTGETPVPLPERPPSQDRASSTVGLTVSRLLAGIVLVDMLAVPEAAGAQLLAFGLMFGLALLLQRTVPAT